MCQSTASWAPNLPPVLCFQERGFSSLLAFHFTQFILPDPVFNTLQINYIFGIALDLQESCKDKTENSHTPHS